MVSDAGPDVAREQPGCERISTSTGGLTPLQGRDPDRRPSSRTEIIEAQPNLPNERLLDTTPIDDPDDQISRRKKLLFAFVPLLTLLLIGEIVARVVRGELFDTRPSVGGVASLLDDCPARYHATLGYVPEPDAVVVLPEKHGAPRGTRRTYTIRSDGLRSNGPQEAPAGDLILAAGDSYTFGNDVSDSESWPSVLERLTGRPVLNAGVFGYGFDQTVLRAEELVPQLHPTLLIVSLIPDDVLRCAYSCRYADKPWFEPDGNQLVLRGVPVPVEPVNGILRALRRALSYSRLADATFSMVAPAWWLLGVQPVRAHDRQEEVARLLVDRLAALSQRERVAVLLLVQAKPTSKLAQVQPVLQRARELGLPTLNLIPRLRSALSVDPSLTVRWYDDHMTAEGNAWVAREIADLLP